MTMQARYLLVKVNVEHDEEGITDAGAEHLDSIASYILELNGSDIEVVPVHDSQVEDALDLFED